MLVLTRYAGEKIVIITPQGERIVITAVEWHRGGKMRVGIEADKRTEIYREEILPEHLKARQ